MLVLTLSNTEPAILHRDGEILGCVRLIETRPGDRARVGMEFPPDLGVDRLSVFNSKRATAGLIPVSAMPMGRPSGPA